MIEGRSQRSTSGGRVLRTWQPPQLDQTTAGCVVYVHGYYTTVDRAWTDHGLPAQFAASRQNAVFSAVSAPSCAQEAVSWGNLDDVRNEIRRLTGIPCAGPTVIVGHSGAYRTLARWLGHGAQPEHVTLLDALYGSVDVFERWIAAADSVHRTMNLITCSTGAPRANSEAMLRRFERVQSMTQPGAVQRRCGIPRRYQELSAMERRARLLYVVAQLSHMGLIESGVVLPIVLRRSPLGILGAQPTTNGDPV